PIMNPSLAQRDESDIIGDFLKMYIHAKDTCDDEVANAFLDTQFLNFYRKTIVTFFKDDTRIAPYFQMLEEAMSRVDGTILGTYDYVLKKEVKTIQEGSTEKYRRLNKRHQFLREV